MDVISSFTGKYFFLSNFFPIKVQYKNRWYPSSEHAYVAAKTTDESLREQISKIEHPGAIKRFGRKLELREGWDDMRILVMREILENKFSAFRSDYPIRKWLDDTRPSILIEGNTWGDRFWGQCPVGEGRNELGKLLMSIRDDITTRFI